MKKWMIALALLSLIPVVTVFVAVAPVHAKCGGRMSQMHMNSMEGMDHQAGMCCSMNHALSKNQKADSKDTTVDHSKMNDSSAESHSQMAMAATQKEKKPGAKAKSEQEATQKEASQKKVKDPVCGMEIDPKSAAAKTTYKGKTYYFCSTAEKEQFEKAPEKYVK